MPRVTCRCGEKLNLEPDGSDRIDCPKCGAKIRLRRSPPPYAANQTGGDGYIRFLCPCGRRLKVPAEDRPVAGKCPDCGRVVPVPTPAKASSSAPAGKQSAQSDSEARTEELDAEDLARLDTWSSRHANSALRADAPISTATGLHVVASGSDSDVGFAPPMMPPPSAVKFETGLRVCPRCNKPVHLGAAICRECGTPVPRQ
jgi:DNA-directed RNA polymerase subunit RPC12/RpoP